MVVSRPLAPTSLHAGGSVSLRLRPRRCRAKKLTKVVVVAMAGGRKMWSLESRCNVTYFQILYVPNSHCHHQLYISWKLFLYISKRCEWPGVTTELRNQTALVEFDNFVAGSPPPPALYPGWGNQGRRRKVDEKQKKEDLLRSGYPGLGGFMRKRDPEVLTPLNSIYTMQDYKSALIGWVKFLSKLLGKNRHYNTIQYSFSLFLSPPYLLC